MQTLLSSLYTSKSVIVKKCKGFSTQPLCWTLPAKSVITNCDNSDGDDTRFVKYGPLWTVILRVDVEDPLAGEKVLHCGKS